MFKLSNRSAHRMDGVHPLLVACVALAMRKYSRVDFGVGQCAVRTIKQQQTFVDNGSSRTMNSKHLPQTDGYSWAIDLYPSGVKDIAKGVLHAEIKKAMDKAAKNIGIELTHGYDWGWDSPHHEIKKIL